jgi:hypothetical protein
MVQLHAACHDWNPWTIVEGRLGMLFDNEQRNLVFCNNDVLGETSLDISLSKVQQYTGVLRCLSPLRGIGAIEVVKKSPASDTCPHAEHNALQQKARTKSMVT